jgi:hypothetical protein
MSGLTAADMLGQSLFSFLPGGDNGPPSQAHVNSDPNSPFSRLADAFAKAVKSESRNGGITVSHRMVTRSGKTIEVDTTIYTPKATASVSSATSEEDDSASPESSRSDSFTSNAIAGIQPNTLIAQIKLRTSSRVSRPVVHSAAANVFEELETTRGTSWQYELHQLRLLNRRLKEDIQSSKAALAKNGGKTKMKKRKAEEASGAGPSLQGGMAPPPMPEPMSVAPRHQMAPGFGLVAPGTSSPYI